LKRIALKTDRKRTLVDITGEVTRAIGHEDGVWLVYVPHTTAGVTINEGADPDVARDILMSCERLIPEDLP
jgi:secondary thiamine-phosphate synthase enzyme